MNKPTKKNSSKASHKKEVKDLDVKPANGGTVRGGNEVHKGWIEVASPSWGLSQTNVTAKAK